MEFNVTLERYEGPYTKLLELVESKKLSITEISLVAVADEYIAYIKSLDQKNAIDISQFIVVASTLMLMKAKSLLPEVIYTNEEEKQVHDLEYKLGLYLLLTNASTKIKSLYSKTPLYSRPYTSLQGINVFVPDERVSQVLLQSVASLTLLSFIAPKALIKVAVEQALRIENVIENLLKRVGDVKTISLQSLADGAKSFEEQKKTLIVTFIALLELLRAGSLTAHQSADGGDIEISHIESVGSNDTTLLKDPQKINSATTPSTSSVLEEAEKQEATNILAETSLSTTFAPLELGEVLENSDTEQTSNES